MNLNVGNKLLKKLLSHLSEVEILFMLQKEFCNSESQQLFQISVKNVHVTFTVLK